MVLFRPLLKPKKLVGDVITTLQNGAKFVANARLDFALRTSVTANNAGCDKRAKQHAMITAVVPKMTPSTLWTKPAESKLNKLRTAIIGTVMGKKGGIRCPEVVTSVCTNPIKTDPKSVLIYRTLLDARRLMRKSDERRNDFIEQIRAMVRRGSSHNEILLGPVKGVLQAAYEWFEATPVRGNDVMLQPAVGPPCSLFEPSDKVFKDFMQTSARHAIWRKIAQQMHMGQSRRKDLAGFHDHINVEATMAASRLAKQWKISEKLWRQMHLTLVSGSVVAGDRLHARKEIENDECPLDGCRHTSEHLLWECTAFDCIRRPFIMQIGDIIGQAVHKGPIVSSYISEIHDSKPFRN